MTDSSETQAAELVVMSFLKDWETGFTPAFERWMHPDAVWQNTGFPDANGKQAIMALLDRYLLVSAMPYGRVDMLSIAARGNKVLTERVDNLWSDDGKSHAAKIMGVFEVNDGLISRYADYFDPTPFYDNTGH